MTCPWFAHYSMLAQVLSLCVAAQAWAVTAPPFVLRWGTDGSGPGQFADPGVGFAPGIAIGPDHTVYVTDPGNQRIQQFTATGSFIRAWGGSGTGPGLFTLPASVACDANGDVYVVDATFGVTAGRIEVFDKTGVYLREWALPGCAPGSNGSPKGIAITGSLAYVLVGNCGQAVQKFTKLGSLLGAWGSGLPSVQYITTDNLGDVFVSAFNSSSTQIVREYDSSGGFVRDFLVGDHPKGIAVDASGTLFVANLVSHNVQEFSSSGAPLLTWGPSGTGDPGFGPMGLAVDGAGNVYISDQDNHCIKLFGQLTTSSRPKTWTSLRRIYR